MSAIVFKPGVGPIVPNPAGVRLLGASDHVARTWPTDLVITCTSDGHPVSDPHSRGQAFDYRTHGWSDDDKRRFCRALLIDLQENAGMDAPLELEIPGIWYALATTCWFVQIERYGDDGEHIHAQLRQGTTFPPAPPAPPRSTTT